MKPCPSCKSKLVKVGPPVRYGYFLDQLLDCPQCDWCGVDSVDAPATTHPQQLAFGFPLTIPPASR